MKSIVRKSGVLLILTVYALMAIASTSSSDSSDSKERGEVKISSDSNTAVTNDGENNENGGGEKTAGETNDDTEEKLKYEVTNTYFNYYTNSIGSIEYYGIVEITNTGNCNIYLDDCVFDIEDNDGHLLQSENYISNCPDIIAPGETGYFYNGSFSSIDSNASLDNGVVLIPSFSLKKSNSDIVDYEVSDTDMRADDLKGLKFTGRVTNNTDEDDDYADINIICYNSDGKVILIEDTSVSDLAAGMTRSFDTSTIFNDDSVDLNSVASYKVIARKSVYEW